MWKKIKKWWTAPNKAEKELDDRLASLEQKLVSANEELAMFRQRNRQDEDKQHSKEPWVEIKSAEFDETKGFRIDLDWNPSFVEYLKESGIKGKTEEQIVQKWLAMLYQDLVEKLEAVVIDQKDQDQTSDFE